MMNAASPTRHPFRLQTIDPTSILERRFADLLLFGVTAAALIALLLLTPTLGLVGWLYVLQHLIVLGFALTRSEPVMTDYSVRSNIAVGVAYACPYAQVICLYWWPGKTTWPHGGLVFTTMAAFVSVLCLLTLGNQFGVRPALRNLITRGPYRLVRHPLYLSYVIAAIGFNLQAWNLATLVLVSLGWASMVYRVLAEERVLSRDRGWPAYITRVRYRLVPGLW